MIIPARFEPSNRILRATIPENESQSKYMILFSTDPSYAEECKPDHKERSRRTVKRRTDNQTHQTGADVL